MFVGKVAAFPANFQGTGGNLGAVIVIGFPVVALDDLQLPAGLRLGLGKDESLRQLHPHFGRRLAVAAMRHLKRGVDGRFGRRAARLECRMRMGEPCGGECEAGGKQGKSDRVQS